MMQSNLKQLGQGNVYIDNNNTTRRNIMRKVSISIGTVIAIMVLLPLIAPANSLHYVDYDSTGYGFNRKIDGRITYANTGAFNAVLYDDNGQPLNNEEWFTGFCVEPGVPIHTGDWLPSSVTPEEFNDGVGLKAAWLLDTYYYGKTRSNVEIAGLQLAIWEAINDDRYDLLGGDFQVISGDQMAQDIAETYLTDLEINYDMADTDRLVAEYEIFVDDGKQDLIFRTNVVPEPSTMLLLASGVLGLVGVSRKRFTK